LRLDLTGHLGWRTGAGFFRKGRIETLKDITATDPTDAGQTGLQGVGNLTVLLPIRLVAVFQKQDLARVIIRAEALPL
jgi:hypothetical protein